jgi:hypothetical protein
MNNLQKFYSLLNKLNATNTLVERANSIIRNLNESIPKLVQIAAEDARNGHHPSIDLHGSQWRYHLGKNVWYEADDPAIAAQGTRSIKECVSFSDAKLNAAMDTIYKTIGDDVHKAIDKWWEHNDPDGDIYEHIDNIRVAFKSNKVQKAIYEEVRRRGHCKSCDVEIKVGRRTVLYGFNYGH